MTTSDDFKEQLKAGKIVDALSLALGQAVELEITTWVSSANSDPNTSTQKDSPTADCRIRTRINIMDGDIDNEVGSQFIGNGPYTELQQFHRAQVQEGPQMIQHNLENLQQLFSVLTSTLSQLPAKISHQGESGSSVLSPSSQDNLP
jgi:hypothetical protein